MSDEDLLDLLREVVIEIAGEPERYESSYTRTSRYYNARARLRDALIALAKESK